MISDGGCTCPGDFSKAFGAGADFVRNTILLYYYIVHTVILPV